MNKRSQIGNRKDSDKTSKVAYLELYYALEQRLKRHAPRDYISYMSKRMFAAWSDSRLFVQTPPHTIMRSIEANCAYWKSGYREPISWNHVAKIMNVYNSFTDPYQMETIADDMDRFYLLMYREQMELQKRAAWDILLRNWQLFVRTDCMRKVANEFTEKIGVTPDQWIKACLLCWFVSIRESGGSFVIGVMENPEIAMSQSTMNVFLSLSARTPEEIGQQYRTIRQNTPYRYHSLLRSCFIERPIVTFSDGSMVVPHTHLLFLHSGLGLYRLMQKANTFALSFGKSFEMHTRRVLQSLPSIHNIITGKTLKKRAERKSCDFLVETEESIFLIECKACACTANNLTDEAIKGNNSTEKVSKGLAQLYSTARDLEGGRFDCLGVNKKKVTFGIVITFGHIPSANSTWYFDSYFIDRMVGKLSEQVYPNRQMTYRPIVLDIQSFERLIIVLRSSNKSLKTLYDERKAKEYHLIGDWGHWLSCYEIPDEETSLEYTDELRKALLVELGIPSEQLGIPHKPETDLSIGRIGRFDSCSPT